MKILLVNDDGVWAQGIRVLYSELRDIANVSVVAPLSECSTTGHTLTLNRPLRAKEIQKNVFGIDGYPADCTLFGIKHLLSSSLPDIVISGINDGGNMGQDLYYSGTAAAAREASFHGFPSIAVSLCTERDKKSKKYFRVAAKFIKQLVLLDIHKYIPKLTFLNVNVPNISTATLCGVKYTKMGYRRYSERIEERIDGLGRKYYWIVGDNEGHINLISGESCDIETVAQNYVSFSLVSIAPVDNTSELKLKAKFMEAWGK